MTNKITMMRGPFRVTWHGGEYADVTAPGMGAIETINMPRRDGSIPEMTREALRAAVDAEDVAAWRDTAAEMRRYPVAGAR